MFLLPRESNPSAEISNPGRSQPSLDFLGGGRLREKKGLMKCFKFVLYKKADDMVHR